MSNVFSSLSLFHLSSFIDFLDGVGQCLAFLADDAVVYVAPQDECHSGFIGVNCNGGSKLCLCVFVSKNVSTSTATMNVVCSNNVVYVFYGWRSYYLFLFLS